MLVIGIIAIWFSGIFMGWAGAMRYQTVAPPGEIRGALWSGRVLLTLGLVGLWWGWR